MAVMLRLYLRNTQKQGVPLEKYQKFAGSIKCYFYPGKAYVHILSQIALLHEGNLELCSCPTTYILLPQYIKLGQEGFIACCLCRIWVYGPL